MLHMLHRLNRNAAMGEALLQALLQTHKGQSWSRCQRGLLHKKAALAQIHGVEEGGGLLTLLEAEVIAAVVHQHELIRIHRRLAKATHHAVGSLPSYGAIAGPAHQGRVMATGIHHQPRAEVVA